MKLESGTIVWIGGVLGLLSLGWVLGALTNQWKLNRNRSGADRARQADREERRKQIQADREVYRARSTLLVRMNLATFVRSGKEWYGGEEDLRRFLSSLDHGSFEHFMDPSVEGPWKQFVASSVELAKARLLTGDLSGRDIWAYHLSRKEWERAAKRSFGALPDTELVPDTHSAEVEPPDSRRVADA